MEFWEAQRIAKRRTLFFLILFCLMTILIAAGAEYALRYFAPQNYHPPYPYLAIGFLLLTFGTTGYQYFSYSLYGGESVALSVGARKVSLQTQDLKERMLLNIVEELTIASRLPSPQVFIIPSKQINAFAAGLKPEQAVVAVTQGALEKLNRDELQGVLGHELGHVRNGDMMVGTCVAAMVMGFFIILIIGWRLLQGSFWIGGGESRSRDRNGQNAGQLIALIGLILIVAGTLTWIAGSILKSFISKEREYLADASAVEFTRNPLGIANALRKIAKNEAKDMPKSSMAFAHLYIDDRTWVDALFGTHPPLEKRIAILEGQVKR